MIQHPVSHTRDNGRHLRAGGTLKPIHPMSSAPMTFSFHWPKSPHSEHIFILINFATVFLVIGYYVQFFVRGIQKPKNLSPDPITHNNSRSDVTQVLQPRPHYLGTLRSPYLEAVQDDSTGM